MTEPIVLDDVEVAGAAFTGYYIYRRAKDRGYTERVVSPKLNGCYIQQVGQLGERAVAKALGLYWSGAGDTFEKPDLDYRIEVRATRRVGQGVKVRPRDADNKRVVGILIEDGKEHTGEFTLLGWIEAGDAKRREWGRRYYGGPLFYEVPLQALRSIDELRQIIRQEQV